MTQARSPRVDAGLLDVLHDRADDGGVAVGDAVDVDFGGVVEEAVDEDGALGRGGDGVAHVVAEFVVAVDDLHGASAEDEAGADEDGIADLRGGVDGFVLVGGGAVGRLVEAELVEHLLEKFAVLGALDRFDAGADDGDAVGLESGGEIERGLAAELDDDAVGLFVMADVEDVLERERLEEKFVAGVVVGGDGLGVRVDHDGLVPDFAQREGGVDATVVELDALADAVGAAAENHDLLLVAVADFVELVVVGRVVVGRVGFEFGGAGVDEAVGGVEVELVANLADFFFCRSPSSGDLPIGEAKGFCSAEYLPTSARARADSS